MREHSQTVKFTRRKKDHRGSFPAEPPPTGGQSMRSILVVTFLSAGALLACANKSGGDGAVGATGSRIIGGTQDDGDRAVVLVTAQDDSSGTGWWCTGSVIARRVVLTAAHCVEDATQSTKMQIMFGTDQSKAQPTDFIDVVSWDHDPQYLATNNIAAGHDAAVLILGTDAPVEPLAINTTPLTDSMDGSPVYVVGYGNDDGAAGTGAGLKRDLTTKLTSLEQGVANVGGPGETTCQGDSGGPSFMTIGGRSVIIGITSYGEEGCVDYGSVTRVDLSASWIQPFIDANGGAGDAGAGGGGGGGGGRVDAGGGGGGGGGQGGDDSGSGGGGDDAGTGGGVTPNPDCVYHCTDYGYSPGQCTNGWYCIPDGELAGCMGQTDC
jgi:V8-like Glu-specific endopeptidase